MEKISRSTGVGQGIEAAAAQWSFAGKAATAFPDHARRSIPGYDEGHALICAISDFFVRPDSVVYELGTSQGELIELLARRHRHRTGVRWIALDVEPNMVATARLRVAGLENVTIELADAVGYDMARSDLVISYYCLQFIAPKHRQRVVDAVYESLHWGGAFLWFEKVRGNDARFQDLFTSLYHDFKTEQGFDADEIMAKARSLKGVLEPFSSEGNRDILSRAGFVDFTPVYRRLCFEGVLAIK